MNPYLLLLHFLLIKQRPLYSELSETEHILGGCVMTLDLLPDNVLQVRDKMFYFLRTNVSLLEMSVCRIWVILNIQ